MKRSFIVLLGAVAASIASAPASAQSVCGDRKEIVSRLESGYQEKASAIGLSGNGGVVELYKSDKGSWTLLLTRPGGVSCLMAAGENWEDTPDSKLTQQDIY